MTSFDIIAEKAEGNIPILTRGHHAFPFKFQLPESSLPCSFESKPCTVRYYVKVTIDIPYASPPQGMKYFTIIGPHIDCMDEQYLVSYVFVYFFSFDQSFSFEIIYKEIIEHESYVYSAYKS
jgi:hypothetical protein